MRISCTSPEMRGYKVNLICIAYDYIINKMDILKTYFPIEFYGKSAKSQS